MEKNKPIRGDNRKDSNSEKPNSFNDGFRFRPADLCQSGMNGSATGRTFDTPLAQDGSASVRTLGDLIAAYQTDPDSSYHKLRYGTRKNHDALLARIMAGYGDLPLAGIKARTILGWHRIWSVDGHKVAMGHSFIGQLRTLFNFGKTLLEDADCARLSDALSSTRFASPKPRTERMTAEQCIAMARRVAYREAKGA